MQVDAQVVHPHPKGFESIMMPCVASCSKNLILEALKHGIKWLSSYMYMKNEHISCFVLDSIPKKSRYVCMNIRKSKENVCAPRHLILSISGTGFSACTMRLVHCLLHQGATLNTLSCVLLSLLTVRHTTPCISVSNNIEIPFLMDVRLEFKW